MDLPRCFIEAKAGQDEEISIFGQDKSEAEACRPRPIPHLWVWPAHITNE
jgi:hypothetical protein